MKQTQMEYSFFFAERPKLPSRLKDFFKRRGLKNSKNSSWISHGMKDLKTKPASEIRIFIFLQLGGVTTNRACELAHAA